MIFDIFNPVCFASHEIMHTVIYESVYDTVNLRRASDDVKLLINFCLFYQENLEKLQKSYLN